MSLGRWTFVTVLAAILAGPVMAEGLRDYPKEGLPDYCRETYDGELGDPRLSRFNDVFGWENFQHMHHYCRGLNKVKRAADSAAVPSRREGYYGDSISEFNYVLRNTRPDFVLRPEVLVQQGSSYLALDRIPEALDVLSQAILLRDDYVPAYVALGNYFLSVDDPAGAREVVEIGLYHVPDSEALLELIARIDRTTS